MAAAQEPGCRGRLIDSVEGGRSADGFTPLHLACFFGHAHIVARLIDHHADVDAVAENPSQVRPLHSAAARNDAALVRQLLASGADPNVAQHGGWTALHSAAKHGNAEMVQVLLQYNADPHQAAEDGTTARQMTEDEQVAELLGGCPDTA